MMNTDLSALEDGKHVIDGENVFVNVMQAVTKADKNEYEFVIFLKQICYTQPIPSFYLCTLITAFRICSSFPPAATPGRCGSVGYENFEAVGVSTAGQVNTKEGTILYANDNIPGYTGTTYSCSIIPPPKTIIEGLKICTNEINPYTISKMQIDGTASSIYKKIV